MNLHRFRKLSYACSQEALIAVTGARNAGSRFTALANWNAETVDVPTAGNTDAPEPKTLEEMPRVESHDPACMAIPRVGSALRKRSATNGEEIEE